jgi:glycyl-tRNA synthetase beta subunit
LRVLLLEDRKEAAFDVVDAVLAEQSHNPSRAIQGIKELAVWVKRTDWENILDSFARVVRITRDKAALTLKAESLTPAESKALHEAAKQAHDKLKAQENVDAMLKAFEPIVPTITTFFDNVMVMDEDQAVRENRLALLQYVAALAKGRADFSKLSGF